MINYVLNNFLGLSTFTSINDVKISEVNVTSSSVTPTFFGAISTNVGMTFFSDIAVSNSTNFTYVNVPLTNCGKILRYSASAVYYFYYFYGSTIGLYSTGSSTVTHTYALDSNVTSMDISGTTLYVGTQNFVYQFSIGAAGVLSQTGVIQSNSVLSIAALSSTTVFIGLKAGGYALNNYSTSSYTKSSATMHFKEAIVNNGYLVGTDNLFIYSELISTINTGVQVMTSLQSLNINGAITIRNLSNAQSSVVTFATGNGIATFTASTSLIASFSNQNALGNQNLIGLSYFDVSSDGVSFLVGNGNQAFLSQSYEKIYTYGAGPYTSQLIYRSYQGRIKLLLMFPVGSTATGSVNLLDENGIILDSWTVASGLITNSGVFGVGSRYCYFDAPLGLTNQSFQFEVVTSSSTEICKIYLEEVPE